MGKGKGNYLAQIVLLKKFVSRCPKIAAHLLKKSCFLSLGCYSAEKMIPSDVPKGHIPVYVGRCRSRFVISATHLNHPLLRPLLEKAAEEWGFDHQTGLFIPCEEVAFECLISVLDAGKSRRVVDLRAHARPTVD